MISSAKSKRNVFLYSVYLNLMLSVLWVMCVKHEPVCLCADHLKEEWQLAEEHLILEEMLEVVEQRDALVALLEEQRLQERQEDQDLEQVMMNQGPGLSWT